MARRSELKSIFYNLSLFFFTLFVCVFFSSNHINLITFKSQNQVLFAVPSCSSCSCVGSLQVLWLFSHNVTVADKCMQPIIVFCVHLTAHTAFDTSITQPEESWACPFAAGSKSPLRWRALVPCCCFMALYGGKLLHVQRRARLNGLDACLPPAARDTDWVPDEHRMAGLDLSQHRVTALSTTVSPKRSYVVLTQRPTRIISNWLWRLKAYGQNFFLDLEQLVYGASTEAL